MYHTRKIPEPFLKKAETSPSAPQISLLRTKEKIVSRKKQPTCSPLAVIAVWAYFSAEKKDGA